MMPLACSLSRCKIHYKSHSKYSEIIRISNYFLSSRTILSAVNSKNSRKLKWLQKFLFKLLEPLCASVYSFIDYYYCSSLVEPSVVKSLQPPPSAL